MKITIDLRDLSNGKCERVKAKSFKMLDKTTLMIESPDRTMLMDLKRYEVQITTTSPERSHPFL